MGESCSFLAFPEPWRSPQLQPWRSRSSLLACQMTRVATLPLVPASMEHPLPRAASHTNMHSSSSHTRSGAMPGASGGPAAEGGSADALGAQGGPAQGYGGARRQSMAWPADILASGASASGGTSRAGSAGRSVLLSAELCPGAGLATQAQLCTSAVRTRSRPSGGRLRRC